MLQRSIPLLPKDAKPVNAHIAVGYHNEEIIFFNAYCPIFTCSRDDQYGLRLVQGILCAANAVKPARLAKALGVNRSTVSRNKAIYQQGGAQALMSDKRDRSAYKLDEAKRQVVQGLLAQGATLRKAGEAVGVTEGCLRYAVRKGTLVWQRKVKSAGQADGKSPSQRCLEDCRSSAGMGVKREAERALAAMGKMDEAPPVFTANESVRYAGVLLALPLLIQLGLLDAARTVYGRLRKGFYGLQSVLLTLAFMALLRIKSPEQLKGKSPGEIGIVVGLDRIPEAMTLRRKLKEMGLCRKAAELMAALTRRWCDDDLDALGFVYIDGHVRPYHGRKHALPKTHVAGRRLCMPATTDVWVNDANSEPLFLVTAEANDGLLSMIETEVIPHMKELAGDRRVTLLFDREGWSPKSFARWVEQGVDVIAYRKGKYDPWENDCFIETRCQAGGHVVTYRLGERSIMTGKGFWMREVRRLCDNGHQASVMTTRQDLSAAEIARRMFFRWTRENFFKYMRHEYNLDHLITYDVEAADGDRLTPSPAYKRKAKEIAGMKTRLEALEKDYGRRALKNKDAERPTMRGFNIANAGCKRKIQLLRQQIEEAGDELKKMPKKEPLKTVVEQSKRVRFETDRHYLMDVIRMCCYRSETALMNLLSPHFSRAGEEGRAFLKGLFELPADILPDENERTLTIQFHAMATPRANRALKAICEIMNAEKCIYPQTSLQMVFKAPNVAS